MSDPTERRVPRATRRCARAAARAAAGGAGADRRRAAVRASAGATTAPRRCRAPVRARPRAGGHAACRHGAAAAARSIRPSRTRASRARSRTRSARRSCATPMRQGLPGTVLVPGPRARPAGHLPGQPHVPRPVARGPDVRGWPAAHDAPTCGDLRAPARSGDALAGRRAVRRSAGLRGVRRGTRRRTCAACARTAARSRSRSSAPIRRSWRGSRCRSRASSRAGRRTGAVPGLLARESTGRYRVLEHSSALIDLERVTSAKAAAERRHARRGGAHLDHAAARCRRAERGDPLGHRPTSRSTTSPAASSPALAVPSTRARRAAHRSGAAGRSPTRTCAARSRWRSTGARSRVSDGGDVAAGALAAARPAGAAARCRPIRRRLARCCAVRAPRDARFDLWAEPGAQARVARSIAKQLAAVGVQVNVRVASAGERPARRAGLDPVAVAGLRRPRCDLHAARRCARRRPAGRRRGARAAASRAWPEMRAARRSGASTSVSAQVDLARFRCCVQTFLRRSRPCWWEEAPIRCSTSTSRCSPHDHDCTPTP